MVLWAYRTTKRRSTGETPFSLAYGTEVIIPPHITVPSISLEVGSIDQNSEQMGLNLDLLEDEREKTIIRVASYQQQLKSYHDKRATGERPGEEERGIFRTEYSYGEICSRNDDGDRLDQNKEGVAVKYMMGFFCFLLLFVFHFHLLLSLASGARNFSSPQQLQQEQS
ncbi:hypothetical protein L3X38_041592 [Prunus dulcis]|uniref:Uncharacterized protein n=1 Tax=Prunus dulcis TaxID=3755 RepID=A0AAD4UTC0_PRUDU|nr:hypothetical protein L3X38_041592 [Prunus dulcis]